MDHVEEINSELTTFKGEQSILLRTKEGGRVVLTNQVNFKVISARFPFARLDGGQRGESQLIKDKVSLNSFDCVFHPIKGRNWLERMASFLANGAQRLSRVAG